MLARHLVIVLLATVVLLLAAACAPAAPAPVATATPSPAMDSSTNQPQSGGVVDATPVDDADLTAQPPGQSQPGGAAGGGSQGGQLMPGTGVVYLSEAYQFQVEHPAGFVVATLPADRLAQLVPKPVASITFMNPVTAASDVADLEPADLEVRVYPVDQGASLEGWLASSGLLAELGGAPLEPFQTPNLSGVKGCPASMLTPSCSHFFLGRGWAYQLLPATVEGESMVQTFRLAQ